ncbi:MAG: dihydrolipoyl dehydrogenase [Acidimicrobiia bacterium]|nr:dihydrolipoyl dehydrogenase [Acidimicrobiia bacterium]
MYDVVILGGGPGGYAAALYAHNFGLSVAMIEKDKIGGTCLHRGCIPAKSWLHSAEVFDEVRHAGDHGVVVGEPTFDWTAGKGRKDAVVAQLHKGLTGLLKARGVEMIDGFGKLAGPGKVEVGGGVVEGRHVILATGSIPRAIPGFEFDGDRIVSSDHALDWNEQPARVGIIGAGAIGLEFASMLSDLGSEVHVFELFDQILPGTDADVAKHLHRALKRRGVHITTGVEVEPPQLGEKSVTLKAGDNSVEVDVVLVAVGRAPVTDGVGLETTTAEVERGYVKVDLATMQTAEPSLYAVGDLVAGTPQLAHAGFAEGMSAITHIATGEAAPVDYRAIPLVVYSRPELATVGLSAAQAVEDGHDVVETSHGFGGAARAIILGQTMGTVKVVAEKDGPILGAAIAGPLAGELIHELMYSVAWEALPSEAAAFIHAHPTVAEAVGETLLAATGKSLH